MDYAELAAMEARPMGLGLALSWQAARAPDAAALSMGEVSYSRAGLDRAANRLARYLASTGVGKDDRVAVALPTGPENQIACFALWKLGATVIPLSARLVDRELHHILAEADPKLVMGIDATRSNGRAVVPIGFVPDETISDKPLPEVVSSMWKASCSGGSTGMPKLIWEHRSSLIDPTLPYPILRLNAGDVMLHPAAAYHNASFTQTNGGLSWGCHVVLMERFDAIEWLRTVERLGVAWAYMVPTMMSRILAIPEEVRRGFDVSSLRMVIHMAAPCPPWVKQAWIDWLGPDIIWEVYGGTEGYGATIIGGSEWLSHRGSVGKAPPGTVIRDDAGRELPPGEVGTIYFVPPENNPMGHSREPRTFGDLGSLDDDGYLYLADRRTDMIITGGVNVYPAEVEGAIEQWPGVIASAVVGLPDDDLGAKGHAVIQMERGCAPPDANDLREFLEDRISKGKIPHSCEFTSKSLRDEAGKLRRRTLREERLDSAGFERRVLRGAQRGEPVP